MHTDRVVRLEVGDLAISDNVALWHHRPSFPAVGARTMRRVSTHHESTMDWVPDILQPVEPEGD